MHIWLALIIMEALNNWPFNLAGASKLADRFPEWSEANAKLTQADIFQKHNFEYEKLLVGLSLYSRERPIWSFACSPAADAAVMCGLKSLVLLGAADGGRYPSLPPSLSRTFCDKDTHSLAHILCWFAKLCIFVFLFRHCTCVVLQMQRSTKKRLFFPLLPLSLPPCCPFYI